MPTGLEPTPETQSEEIDVTELIERIEALEKEISTQKEIIEFNTNYQKGFNDGVISRITDCEDSIDALAGNT